MTKKTKLAFFAIGYSTHTIESFIELLKAHDIQMLIDIRSIPKSRHCPEYNQDVLKKSLKMAHIGYRHIQELGGLRHTLKDSINTGWTNSSFRGFADYMQTPSFQKGLEKLEKIIAGKRAAMMCAEGNPWRCHRSLIADALTLRNWDVFEIQSRITAKIHTLTPFLRVEKGQLFYPAEIP